MYKYIKPGLFFSLLTATISGFSIFYNKLVIIKGLDPLIFNILKNGGVSIILTFILITLGTYKKLFSLSKKDLTKIFAIALLGGSIPFILFFEGLKIIPATNASLIQKTLFIWVAFMAVPFLKEKISKFQIFGYLLVICANFLLGGVGKFTIGRGEIMIFIATLLWSIEYIIIKLAIKNIDFKLVAWARMFIGTLILLSIAVYQNKLNLLFAISGENLILSLGSILFLSFYIVSLIYAISLYPVTRVTSVLILSTLITNVLTAVFINHNTDIIFNLSNLLTIIGIIIITKLISLPKPQLAKINNK